MTEGKPSNKRWKVSLILLVVLILLLLPPAAKLGNSSIVAGASLTVVFSALYLLFARSNSPKGARIFRAQGIIGLLLVSLICAIPGLAIIHYSGYLNRRLLGDGVLITFGGMILGAVIFSILANCFWEGEKKHFKEDLAKKGARTRGPLLQRKIKARASVVWMKGHPYLVVLFCLVGWIVGIAMLIGGLFGEAESSFQIYPHNQSIGLILMGVFISLGYTCALVLVFVMILRGRWDSYFDAAIEKVDLEVKRLQEQSPSSSGQK
jgi:hypothetical protein